MWVSDVQVYGHAGFSDSGPVKMLPGLTVFIGQNNAGKSAFLSALGHQLPHSPHRNEDKFRLFELPPSRMQMCLHVTSAELREAVLIGGHPVSLPSTGPTEADRLEIRRWFEQPEHILLIERTAGALPILMSSEGLSPGATQEGFVRPVSGSLTFSPNNTVAGIQPFGFLLQQLWTRFSFHFGPQRYSVGSSGFERAEKLTPNASNLPSVLAALAGDRGDDFQSLVDQVSEIFENVGNISVTTTPGGFEVRTWPTKRRYATELSFSLNDSGTGVAQIIAILVAALTTPAGVIIIDEISSFLHPAAAKALLRILQTRYPHHQYLVSTHSPEIISSATSSGVFLVRREGYDSIVQSVNLADVRSLREVCGILGVTMSDVFAADGIIWVEGQTEEALFPYLYAETKGAPPKGVLVTAVVATGDFNAKRKRDRQLAFEVYQKLSVAAAPLVRTSMFSFDQEGLTEEDQTALQQQAMGHIRFLPRRNIESFFIHPDAIADVINGRMGSSVVSGHTVNEWLMQNGPERAYKAEALWDDAGIRGSRWLSKVDGAKLLSDLVLAVSGNQLEFSKTRDSINIVRYLLAFDRSHLDPIATYVAELYVSVTPKGKTVVSTLND